MLNIFGGGVLQKFGAFMECFMGHFKRGILQLFQKILMVHSGSVLEQTKVYSR